MRALAAIAVLINHTRSLYFLPYNQVAHTHFNALLYFLTGFGHQAVMVFFVLSGMLIGYSVLKPNDGRSWRDYGAHRVARLYVVLIPALLLTALWDQFGMHLFSASDIYRGSAGDAMVPYVVAQHAGILTAIGNALNLQSIVVEPFGSNGPLWSLSYEFWYYVLFPLCVIALTAKISRRALAVIAAAVVLWLIGANLRNYFPIWLMGVAVLFLPAPALSRALRYACASAALLLFGIAAALARIGEMSPATGDYLVGVAVALLLYALIILFRGEALTRTVKRTAGHELAGFAYTLYLAHLPLLVFIAAWLLPGRALRWSPDASHLLLACGLVLGALIYSYLLSRVTERHTGRVRRWLRA